MECEEVKLGRRYVLTLNVVPRKWKCSNGHQWQDLAGTQAPGLGLTLTFPDPNGAAWNHDLRTPTWCMKCMHEKIIRLFADVGVVEELKS